MLDTGAILRLVDELKDEQVLSVYIAVDDHDPALRQAWRRRLDHSLDAARAALGDEREAAAFDGARRLLARELKPVKGFLQGPGWLAFVTPAAVRLSGPVPAPTPDLVRWRRGPVVGPALRARKQDRPVLLALVDRRRARVLRYLGGALEELLDVRADTFIDDLTDCTASKRAGTRTGSRGEAATDTAARILQRGMLQLLGDVAPRLREHAGADGVILLAGSEEARVALRGLLTGVPAHRICDDLSLAVTASPAEAQVAVAHYASALTERRQRRLVDEVLDEARAGGRGALGLCAIRRAVAGGQVDRMLVAADFARAEEAAVESLIAQCLAMGGEVETVAGEPAVLLGPEGIAARLRFVPAG
jgi:hypothetical protein